MELLFVVTKYIGLYIIQEKYLPFISVQAILYLAASYNKIISYIIKRI